VQIPGPLPLWQLVARLERLQLEDWRKQHYPAVALELAAQESLLKVETTVTRLRNRNISVTVAVLDKKDSNSLAGYFRLRPALEGRYQVSNGTLSVS
jgi:hypothetical protein